MVRFYFQMPGIVILFPTVVYIYIYIYIYIVAICAKQKQSIEGETLEPISTKGSIIHLLFKRTPMSEIANK